jgi:hypothetical protein
MHQANHKYFRIRSFLCFLYPKPNSVLILYDSAEKSLNRKNQLTPENLEVIQSLYARIADDFNFRLIKCNRQPDSLSKDIVNNHFAEIIKHLRK